MTNHDVEHVPVVQDGEVAGILSSFDLVACLLWSALLLAHALNAADLRGSFAWLSRP